MKTLNLRLQVSCWILAASAICGCRSRSDPGPEVLTTRSTDIEISSGTRSVGKFDLSWTEVVRFDQHLGYVERSIAVTNHGPVTLELDVPEKIEVGLRIMDRGRGKAYLLWGDDVIMVHEERIGASPQGGLFEPDVLKPGTGLRRHRLVRKGGYLFRKRPDGSGVLNGRGERSVRIPRSEHKSELSPGQYDLHSVVQVYVVRIAGTKVLEPWRDSLHLASFSIDQFGRVTNLVRQ